MPPDTGWGLAQRAPGSGLYLPVRSNMIPGAREQEKPGGVLKSPPWEGGGRPQLKAGEEVQGLSFGAHGTGFNFSSLPV